jgi:hypothetical protein
MVVADEQHDLDDAAGVLAATRADPAGEAGRALTRHLPGAVVSPRTGT